jgi:hypothetical protein
MDNRGTAAERAYLISSQKPSEDCIFEPEPVITQRKSLASSFELSPGDWALICGGKLDLWFYCVLAYADFMQTRHEASFCWRWQDVGMGMGWPRRHSSLQSKNLIIMGRHRPVSANVGGEG